MYVLYTKLFVYRAVITTYNIKGRLKMFFFCLFFFFTKGHGRRAAELVTDQQN